MYLVLVIYSSVHFFGGEGNIIDLPFLLPLLLHSPEPSVLLCFVWFLEEINFYLLKLK